MKVAGVMCPVLPRFTPASLDVPLFDYPRLYFTGEKIEAQRREVGDSPGQDSCPGLTGSTPPELPWQRDMQGWVWRAGGGWRGLERGVGSIEPDIRPSRM